MKHKIILKFHLCRRKKPNGFLSELIHESPGQLNELWHDGDVLAVDGAQVGFFEKTDEVSFASNLEGHDGRTQ